MYTKNSKTHLPLLDLIEIVKDSNINSIILAHVNPMGELKYEEWGKKLSEYTIYKTNIKTNSIDNDINKFAI